MPPKVVKIIPSFFFLNMRIYPITTSAAPIIATINDMFIPFKIALPLLLPINLSSLEAFSGYLAFLVPRDTVSEQEKYLTFEICTNRGKAFQKTFLLQ